MKNIWERRKQLPRDERGVTIKTAYDYMAEYNVNHYINISDITEQYKHIPSIKVYDYAGWDNSLNTEKDAACIFTIESNSLPSCYSVTFLQQDVALASLLIKKAKVNIDNVYFILCDKHEITFTCHQREANRLYNQGDCNYCIWVT